MKPRSVQHQRPRSRSGYHLDPYLGAALQHQVYLNTLQCLIVNKTSNPFCYFLLRFTPGLIAFYFVLTGEWLSDDQIDTAQNYLAIRFNKVIQPTTVHEAVSAGASVGNPQAARPLFKHCVWIRATE